MKSVAEIHQPVLAEVCADLLAPALDFPPDATTPLSSTADFHSVQGPILIDATLGMGGHSAYLLERHPQLRIIGIDRDPQARGLAASRLSAFANRLSIVGTTYGELDSVLAQHGLSQVDGILADLGVSSLQLDETERGFAYAHPEAPLDMRMNQTGGFTAADFLNLAGAEEIAAVLHTYGEEKFAWPIAKAIVRTRANQPMQISGQLVEIIRDTIPAPARRSGGNPAKRTFQALRVAVNDELGDLQRFLTKALSCVRVGGRIVIESYQSLEDRLVKQAFAAGIHPAVPKGLPVLPEQAQPWLRDLTRGSRLADESEVAKNPRAASLRLRAVEKTREPDPENLSGNLVKTKPKPMEQRFPTLTKLRRQNSVSTVTKGDYRD